MIDKMETKKEFIERFKKWIKENALDETTHSDCCSDDGFIFFKRTEIEKQGDWSQEDWNENIEEFEERYLYYEELLEFLKQEEDSK